LIGSSNGKEALEGGEGTPLVSKPHAF